MTLILLINEVELLRMITELLNLNKCYNFYNTIDTSDVWNTIKFLYFLFCRKYIQLEPLQAFVEFGMYRFHGNTLKREDGFRRQFKCYLWLSASWKKSFPGTGNVNRTSRKTTLVWDFVLVVKLCKGLIKLFYTHLHILTDTQSGSFSSSYM